MPDWTALLREHLANLALPPAEREEIIAELASHLQESYDVSVERGLTETEAFEQVISGLGDCQSLARNIYRAKQEGNGMSGITRQLWLPGLLSMVTIILILRAAIQVGVPTQFFNSVLFLGLPFVGALGAYLSRRAGGSRRVILASGLFPAAAMLFVVVLVIVLGALLGWPVPAPERARLAIVLAALTLGLALGILPFLRAAKRGCPAE